ncbi:MULTISPECIES: thiosulfate sulfurtransferase GlpE [Rheinheimera]|uniref:thiosulfate sulfurtransferase GlpE n=1 Tax=Rheinheimera TaxID=67575 RepID=UPI001048B404|nr:thiosulfate sulfurtransferase GlpE [Rheinheimera sp. D18]QBL08544.1 thiosulfate sulfurtransferase GlpE [Rheinheimera sp. D18]
MSEFQHISVMQTAELLAAGKVVVADIRDEQSYNTGHIEGAYHLTNGSLNSFMQQFEFDQPVVVVCYHGNSSQGAAQYLVQQGFEQVFSLDGGFESWRTQQPFVSDDRA